MRATKEYIIKQFTFFNDSIFSGRLPLPDIRIGQSRSMLGSISAKRRHKLFKADEFYDFKLTVSARFDLPEREIEDTLIHEMIHYHIMLNGIKDTSSHGKIFRSIMEDINRRFGREIRISHKLTLPELDQDMKTRTHYVGIVTLEDGRRGICIPASTRYAFMRKKLPDYFKIADIEWFVTNSPFFNRFPHCITPKIILTDMDEVEKHLVRQH